jgi:hypothetical protein
MNLLFGKDNTMASSPRTLGLTILLTVTVTVILLSCIVPGCTQNQDNSPVNVVNSPGRRALSVTCSTDGAVAYVTDGRNVYRFAAASGAEPAWQCILSQTQRLQMAAQYDPCEAPFATQ